MSHICSRLVIVVSTKLGVSSKSDLQDSFHVLLRVSFQLLPIPLHWDAMTDNTRQLGLKLYALSTINVTHKYEFWWVQRALPWQYSLSLLYCYCLSLTAWTRGEPCHAALCVLHLPYHSPQHLTKVPKRSKVWFRLTWKLPGCVTPYYLLF